MSRSCCYTMYKDLRAITERRSITLSVDIESYYSAVNFGIMYYYSTWLLFRHVYSILSFYFVQCVLIISEKGLLARSVRCVVSSEVLGLVMQLDPRACYGS